MTFLLKLHCIIKLLLKLDLFHLLNMSDQTKQTEDQVVAEHEKEKSSGKKNILVRLRLWLPVLMRKWVTVYWFLCHGFRHHARTERKVPSNNQHPSVSTIRYFRKQSEEWMCTLAASGIIMMQSWRIWHCHQIERIVGTDKGVVTSLSKRATFPTRLMDKDLTKNQPTASSEHQCKETFQ